MVKQIVRDAFFLGQKSEPATKADIPVGIDLQDTPYQTEEGCLSLDGIHGYELEKTEDEAQWLDSADLPARDRSSFGKDYLNEGTYRNQYAAVSDDGR